MAMIGADMTEEEEVERNRKRWKRLEEDIKQFSHFMPEDKARELAWKNFYRGFEV